MTFSSPHAMLQDLDARARDIFQRIVNGYIDTGEPVGSRSLSRLLPSGLSPASVRNVMSDLEHLGLVYAPHVSAGRVPTEQGLRFFVDAFLEIGDVDKQEQARIERQISSSAKSASLDHVMSEAGRVLSGLTQGAGIVLAQKQNAPMKHIEFVQLERTKALAVLVLEDGNVENRVLDLPAGITQSALAEAGNYLNAHMRGRTLAEAENLVKTLHGEARVELDKLSQKIVDAGIASWAGGQSNEPPQLVIRGQSNLLADEAIAGDLDRVRRLFDDLESKRDLMQLLGLAEKGDGVRIYIGSENSLFSLSGSSLIVSPYKDEDNRVAGVLGVIGPTRLNYARVIPTVDFTAKMVGKAI